MVIRKNIHQFFIKTTAVLLFFLIKITGFGQSAEELIQEAFLYHPELKALQLEYQAALQKVQQSGLLPDPVIGTAFPVLRPETRLGGQIVTFSASQIIPAFGKLNAQKEIPMTIAQGSMEKIEAARREVIFQIKDAWLRWHLLDEQQQLLQQKLPVLAAIKEIALSKVEAGKASAADVLGVELQEVALEQQLVLWEEEKNTYLATIEEVTGQTLQQLTASDSLTTVAVLNTNLDQYRLLLESHPNLKVLDWQIATSKKEQQLNQLASKPDLGVGLDYSIVNERTDAFPVNNGRDILVPRVMMTLPIQKKKYAAKNEEELLQQKAFLLKKEQLVNQMLRQIKEYLVDYRKTLLEYDLAKKQADITRSAAAIIRAAYSTKGTRFDELLQLENELTNYQLTQLIKLYNTHLLQLKINKLTGFEE